jgi:cytochrome c biogenesis protein CcdA
MDHRHDDRRHRPIPQPRRGDSEPSPTDARDPPGRGVATVRDVLARAVTAGPRAVADWPTPTRALAAAIGVVGVLAALTLVVAPFGTAAFGGLTIPVVLAAGVADGLDPCAFALLVLFATYTLTLVSGVAADGTPTPDARRRLLGAGSVYVGAVWVTYFVIGLGLLSFLAWLGEDHLVTRAAAVLALAMGVWMLKDVVLPDLGAALAAPAATHRRLHRAIERGGLAGMLTAGSSSGSARSPARAPSISTSWPSSTPRAAGRRGSPSSPSTTSPTSPRSSSSWRSWPIGGSWGAWGAGTGRTDVG